MGIIQEQLNKFLSFPDNKIVNHGAYCVAQFTYLNKVLAGTSEDFLIFDNSSGRKFDIVFGRQQDGKTYLVKDLINYLLENHVSWIYCYQLDGEQVIINEIK